MFFEAYHNSQDLFYREPFGAVPCGRRIILRIQTRAEIPVETCVLRLWENGREIMISLQQKPEFGGNPVGGAQQEPAVYVTLFEGEYEAPANPGLLWYYFVMRAGTQTYYYGNNEEKLGGEGRLAGEEPSSYQITVYQEMQVPEWYRRGTMYQVFVDRFYQVFERGVTFYPRKNALLHAQWSDRPVYIKDAAGRVTDWDFFGGNLQGVMEKLPYFRELGISILYFNPIFAASSNHKYDTADYHRIDPMYGDEEVFQRLIEQARHYGIVVLLDGVFSHTGSDSIYFNKYGTYPGIGAYQSVDSPYYAWYQFKGSREEYKCWWGIDSLPEVDEMNTSYRRFIYGAEDSVLQKWLSMGIAGWRLDVADELPDQFIQELRQSVKRINPQAVLIGEVWEDASNKISYGRKRQYFWGNELDAAMNYPFRATFLRFVLGQSDARSVHQEVMSLYENYPRENFYAAMNLLGSHDTPRILTLLGEAPPEQELTETERRNFELAPPARHMAVQRLKLFSLVQMTFPGVPCIYYGDEAGVEGYSDPFNRGTYPWGKEDRDIRQWYQRLLRLRAEYEVVQGGDFRSFFCEQDVYGFMRSGREEVIIILINPRAEDKTVNLDPKIGPFPLVIDLLTGERLAPETLKALPLSALSGRALLGKKMLPQPVPLHRSCGVLLHISSLPSAWGRGDFGHEAYDFVDFLADTGQSLWQVLPLNPAGLGDSPYLTESVFAGDPLLISLEHLIREGLLSSAKTQERFKQIGDLGLEQSVLSQRLKTLKRDLLYEAFKAFQTHMEQPALGTFPQAFSPAEKSTYLSQANYARFQEDNKIWLDDYVLFRALKAHLGEIPWYDWEPGLAARKPEELAEYAFRLREEICFVQFLQYTFFAQWQDLKTYANAKGVQVVGDLPHFAAADSCDVWANRSLFALDERGKPAKIAGVPPDYFSRTGQLWGNPVYNWEASAATQYDWWKNRIKFSLERFDFLRLDHFRGFEAYWEVDAGAETAEQGRWIKGPGKRFFESLAAAFGSCPFIAEDLGLITPEVNILKEIFGFPGMKVLQFAPSKKMPANDGTDVENVETNIVYYSGTHDNDTLLGWYLKHEGCKEAKEEANEETCYEINEEINDEASPDSSTNPVEIGKQVCRGLLEGLYVSPAMWVILPMQDILGLGEDARMNVPGTSAGNWQWRLDPNLVTDEVKSWLRNQAEKALRGGTAIYRLKCRPAQDKLRI